jgi:hypothetical protein
MSVSLARPAFSRPVCVRGASALGVFPIIVLPQADNVAPDYKTQAGALLNAEPVRLNTLNEPDGLAEYFRAYC